MSCSGESIDDGSRAARPSGSRFIILLPVFNDWTAVASLLNLIDRELANASEPASVVIVDDGSTVEPSLDLHERSLEIIDFVAILRLKRNMGHQRAIAIGLSYIAEHLPGRSVIVMDSDGEDLPSDIPRLLEAFDEEGGRKVVFAERTNRSESGVFVGFYQVYKLLHVLLTGIVLRVGNFSVIPANRINSLVVLSEIWSHYPAAMLKSRIPFTTIPTRRGRRLSGSTHMDFVRLVVHGLSALSVFSDVIGVRVLVSIILLILLTLTGLGITVAIRLLTNLAIPGWATTLVGLLCVILLQALMFAVTFSFMILSGRQGTTFLPCRDYVYYTNPIQVLYQKSCPNPLISEKNLTCSPQPGTGNRT